MLGPLQVRVGGRAVEFRTDAQRALLAYLAAHQGAPQRRDALAGLLSPDRGDREALTYLRNRFTRLRRALGDDQASPPWFAVDRKQIGLRAGADVVVDAILFEQLVGTVERHAHRRLAGCPSCLARLQEAVGLVRGELLAGLNFPSDTWESWLLTQREHYTQRALEAMTRLRDARRERGEWAAALDVAQRQLALEPWLEAAHRAIMEAHYQGGDRNAALAQFAQCQDVLWEELGVEPEEETRRLQQEIRDSGLAPPKASAPPDNLPLQANRFWGRETEQARLLHLLVDPAYRLITIVGTGGIGKTRLAIEAGAQVKESFPDGVWFASLDAVKGGAEQIQIAIGEAAGLGRASQQLTGDQVLAILREKQMLLILDNCETVLDALGFIPLLLRRAPGVAILATSREPLNFQAESVVLLAGLPMGEGGIGPAEQMFAEQGRMARDTFVVSAENLPQVRRICELVDGMPLGIALAAAWVRRRSLGQIIDAMGRSLDFLSARQRDIDPRHRSIRAVFETSWQMLDAPRQQALAALSIFPTTFSAEAAAAVAGATLLDLDALCEKSLLQQHHEQERYIMHSLVRQFAAEKLVERAPVVQRALVAHFHRFARLHQADYARLQPEWANLSSAVAMAHALADWPAVLDLVQTLDDPWFRQIRFQDMRAGLALAVGAARALEDEPALARTLLRLGEIETELNDYAAADAHLAEALNRCMRLEEGPGIAQARYLLGRIKSEQGEDAQALQLFEESRRLFEEENDRLGVARNLNLIAVCHVKKYRDFQAAQAYLEEAVAVQRRLPASSIYVETLRYLARAQMMRQAYGEAETSLFEASKVSQELHDIGEYAAVLYERLLLYKLRHRWDDALTVGYECLDNFHKLGSLRWEGLIQTQLGLLHQAKDEYEQALVLLTQGLHTFDEVADRYEQAYSYYYLHRLYAQMGKTEESLQARRDALRLNAELQDPQLTEQLK